MVECFDVLGLFCCPMYLILKSSTTDEKKTPKKMKNKNWVTKPFWDQFYVNLILI